MLGRGRYLLVGAVIGAALTGPAAWSAGRSAPGAASPAVRAVVAIPAPVAPVVPPEVVETPTTTEPAPPPTAQASTPVISGAVPSDEHWYAIGRCEQPGSGLGGVDWTAHDANYGGGLGFATSTWRGFRHQDMPANAWEATPAQQIAVANDLWRLYGASPWGCKTNVP